MINQENEHTKTRERILKIACEVFAKRGFRKTTVRDICQQAGVNVASVNYYFSSKEKLYEEVCKYACGISSEDGDARFKLKTGSTPEEQLKVICSGSVSKCSGHKTVQLETHDHEPGNG